MKLRYTTLDVLAAVTELKNSVRGLRIVNIYDVNYKTYLLKLLRDDKALVLLIESGIRIHTTDFAWPKRQFPSPFAMKLRKHLKNRHITSVFQLGIDRVVCLKIGSGKDAYHLVVELFDKGNIVLLDGERRIVAILRKRRGNDNDYAVGSEYSLEGEHSINTDCNKESIENALAETEDKAISVKDFLFRRFHIGLAAIEQVTDKDPLLKQSLAGVEIDDLVRLHEKIISTLNKFVNEASKGVVTCQHAKESDKLVRYTGFYPLLIGPDSKTSADSIVFDTFCGAVDTYFSQLEKQKEDEDILQKEKAALSKLHNVASDIEKRSKGLQAKQEEYHEKATIIQENAEIVGQALLVLQNALANHLSWDEVADMVITAKQQNNPVASIVEELKFIDGIAVLRLWDESSGTYKKVEVDVGLGVYANVQLYHSMRKELADKEKRTKEATEKALKSAKKKTDKMLKQTEAIIKIGKRRKYFWFEKFYWFISSQNYLVIAGRDQHQNNLLVKKYLSADDIYVHATIQGASSVVIKNHKGGTVPVRTLNEAAAMAVCYSRAWDNKVLCPAYWVHAHQVSRSAPTGEYLTAGSFIITGKRNFIQPEALAMGFGLVFKVSEEDFEEHHKNDARHQATHDVDDGAAWHDLAAEETPLDREEKEDEVIRIGVTNEEVFVENAVKHVKHHPQKMMRQIAKKKSEAKKNKTQPAVKAQVPASTAQTRSKRQRRKKKIDDDEYHEIKKITAEIQGQPISENADEAEADDTLAVEKDDDGRESDDGRITEEIEKLDVASEDDKSDREQGDKSERDDEESEHEEGDREDAEDEEPRLELTNIINTLVENPHRDDELLFCLVICAPYSALSNYRFKAKLQPGTTKRGKAGKQIISHFCQEKLTTAAEKNLIKAMKDTEICQNIPGSVKVSGVRVAAIAYDQAAVSQE